MKQKIVIRIRRKNEFNPYWATLILYSITLVGVLFVVRNTLQAILLMLTALIILSIALLYQGFEIIKE